MLNRRDLLIVAGAASTAPWLPSDATAAVAQDSAAADLPPLTAAAFDAYIFTIPLIESASARYSLLTAEPGRRPGQLFFQREPTNPKTQRITTPNNDTLNGRGWFDLAQGPIRIRWAPVGDRYMSIGLLDMYSNNFAVLGSRTTGPGAGDFTVVGPTATVPPGAIRSPTWWMWLLQRVLSTGGADLAPARTLQNNLRVDAPTMATEVPKFAGRDAPWQEYLASAGRLLAENPGTPFDTAVRRRMAPLNLERFDPRAFDAAQSRQIADGIARARALLREVTARRVTTDGWAFPLRSLGDFRQDYLYRARTAINGFAALPLDEAMYLFATRPNGNLKFDSARNWRLHIPGNAMPPNDAFWSLAMYRATPDGHFYFFDNPINRYSIGDRTPGLRRTADGSIEIWMQRKPPPADAPVNWLPTPNDAPFGTAFRVYRPRNEVSDGRWRLSPIEERSA